MCDICHRTPCDTRCPNAPEPPTVYICKECGETIVEGDAYYEFDGNYYHEECFEDSAIDILLYNGATKGVAEIEEPDYYDD